MEVATSDSGFDVFLPHADSTDVSVPTGSSPSNAEILFRPPLRSFEQSRIDSVPGIAFDGLTRSGPSEDPIRSFNLGSPSLLPSLVTPVESGKMSSSSYLMQNSFDKSDRSKGSKTGKSPQLLQSILEREVLLCPLDKVPGKEVKRYLGPLQLHFVKDAWTGRSDQSSDTYSFIEVASMNAMAHVSSLGGNALLCYKLVMQEPAHKLSSRSHSYTLVTVTGDVVSLGDISQSPIASPTMMSRHTSVGIEMDPVARRTSRVTSSSSVGGGIGQTRDRNTSGSTSTGTLTGLSAEADPKIFRSQSTDASDIAFALAAHSPSSASSSARNK